MTHNNQIMQESCWVCGKGGLSVVKKSNITSAIKSDSFAITDSTYGVTSELSKCSHCGFIQSTGLTDVLSFYENLEDPTYEANRKERLLQAEKIVTSMPHFKKGAKLLDIGAGSGIFVEAAIKAGYDAEGIEPSSWLQNKATEHGLPVTLGTFPNKACSGPYDVITIVDVIEHVNNPVSLLEESYKALAQGGIIIVVTPDVSSFVAKVLKYKWWHFRIAHIGYFNATTLHRAFTKAGFIKKSTKSAKWYFALDYLMARVNTYMPSWGKLPIPSFFSKITVPLNLFDSILAIYKKP
jgi:2-polyprenyl-3-methyl-5-hydroxy-6-metoxy-1,4-benzoquinol methylase